ncbi:Ig-like domain-containing protein [Ekhidna sp. MALMAid0563]|uniref:Ig-like domain-containing protein n=1 Tax=Ekhidna sp. MALMAid0563 TaxID=3143937 RepID=UPI0032DE32A9
MIKLMRAFSFLAIPLLVFACGSDDNDVIEEPEEPWLEAIELDLTTLTLEVTDTDTLTVITDIGDSTVVWESSDPDVVKMGEEGGLLALKSGTATITASVGGLTATCDVIVDLTIFVGGSAREFEAAYWKNGKINYLTITGNNEGLYSWVNNIKALNGHLYAGGIKLEQHSIIWKDFDEIILGDGYQEVKEMATMQNEIYAVINNGNLFKLSETDGLSLIRDEAHIANSIYIDKDDIYVGGITQYGNESRPAIWKNGNELVLDYDEYTWITDVFVSQDIFYACGYENLGAGVVQARYWENTVKANLTEGSTKALVKSIVVDDDDIYIAGSLNHRPAVWKNGEVFFYAESGIEGSIAEIIMHDGNLYAAGGLDLGTNSVGVVWKNAEEIFRTDVFDQGYINCIEIK